MTPRHPTPPATGQAAELPSPSPTDLIQLRCYKDRYRKSFLLGAITLFNTSV